MGDNIFGSRKFQTRSEIFRVREMNGCQPMCNIQGENKSYDKSHTTEYNYTDIHNQLAKD